MKIAMLHDVGREITHWCDLLLLRGAAPERIRSRPQGADENFDATEWSDTEWSETSPESLALSGPIETTELSR